MLQPKLSWYLAPFELKNLNGDLIQKGHFNLINDGQTKYEFWIKEAKDGFVSLVRDYNNGDQLLVEVMEDKFEFLNFEES